MPAFNGNDEYLSINGHEVTSFYRRLTRRLVVGNERSDHGAGKDWEQHLAQKRRVEATATIIYDDEEAATNFSNLWTEDMVVAVVSGPESDVTGKPKHDQDFIITNMTGPDTNSETALVEIEIQMISTDDPRSNIYAGDTW